MKLVDSVDVTYIHTCDYIEGFSFTETKDKKNNESLDVNVCICEMVRIVNDYRKEKTLRKSDVEY